MGAEKRTNGCGEKENGCGEKENGCGEKNKWVRRREQMGEEKSTIVLWGHCSWVPVSHIAGIQMLPLLQGGPLLSQDFLLPLSQKPSWL